jgi:uncharacterized protein (UPF0261 family)
MAIVVLIGTLDTKGAEYGWIRDRLGARGVQVILIDTGVLGEPLLRADIPREEVAQAGGVALPALRGQGDRGVAVAAMARGARRVVLDLYERGRLHGVLSVGGSGNSTISTTAMRALPVGLPKLMVSSMTSGDVSPYVGTSDITMMYSVVDVAGLNRISTQIFANAADAMAAMAAGYAGAVAAEGDRPLIGATMLGVTTPAVDAARQRLTALGYEVLVFHATGAGDRTMEEMAGSFAGILDLTLVELANELVAGNATCGPDRLRAPVPRVVAPGALDMVKFGPVVPPRFADRHVWVHNSAVTVIRTTAQECSALGTELAARLRANPGPVAVHLPLRGLSTLSVPGGPYHDPAADTALFTALRSGLLGSSVEIRSMDADLATPAFGHAAAEHLHALVTRARALSAQDSRSRG